MSFTVHDKNLHIFLGIFFNISLITRDRKACVFILIVRKVLLNKLILY